MSNQSYSFSYSNYESIYRLVTMFCGQYQTSLFGEVVADIEGTSNLPGESTIKILNLATRTNAMGKTIKTEFPNLVNVPVLNTFQNISCPKVSVGQRGVIVFNKHPVPDNDLEVEELVELPDPNIIFTLNDGLFIPTAPQVNPSENTTEIASPVIDLSAEVLNAGAMTATEANFNFQKFEVSNGTNDLINKIADLLSIIGEVAYTPGTTTINSSPGFATTLAEIIEFVKNPTPP